MMNFKLIYLIVFLYLLMATSVTAAITVIQGTSPFKENVVLKYHLPEAGYQYYESIATVKEDSIFFFQISISEPLMAQIEVSYGHNLQIFLVPDDTLKIAFDLTDSGNFIPHFYGSQAFANQLIQEEKEERRKFYITHSHCSSLDAPLTYSQCHNIYQTFLLERFNQIWVQAKVSPFLKNYFYNNIIYGTANSKLLYLSAHALNTGIPKDSVYLNPGFFSFLDTLPVQNPKALISSEYRKFTGYYIWDFLFSERTRKGFLYHKDSLYSIALFLADSTFSGEVGCYIKAALIRIAHQQAGADAVPSQYQQFLKECARTPYAENAQKNFLSRFLLSPGNYAPPIVAQGLGEDSFDLAKLKGKMVLLNFWASWCGPCLANMKKWKSQKQQFDSLHIVVVHISLDQDENKWRSTVKQLAISGINVRISGYENSVAQSYNLQAVPRYFLIDAMGKILDLNPTTDAVDLQDLIEKLELYKH